MDYKELTELRREVVASTECPRCGAPKGEPCWAVRDRPRKAVHVQRLDVFRGLPPRGRKERKTPIHPLK